MLELVPRISANEALPIYRLIMNKQCQDWHRLRIVAAGRGPQSPRCRMRRVTSQHDCRDLRLLNYRAGIIVVGITLPASPSMYDAVITIGDSRAARP